MAKANTFKRFYDFIVSINYGSTTPMSWGVWVFDENKYKRVYSYYYNSGKEGRIKTDEEYISEMFDKLDKISHFSFSHSSVTFLTEPYAAGFIEILKRATDTKDNMCIKIIPYEKRPSKIDIFKVRSNLIKKIRLCLSSNIIKLPFDIYKTVEDYPDKMLQEIVMFLDTPIVNLTFSESRLLKNNNYKEGKHNMQTYLITFNDITDSIYYVKAKTEKQAIIKLADYFGVDIKFIHKIIDNVNVEDIVDLFTHYDFNINTILKIDNSTTLYGSIADNHIITVIDC